MITIPKHKDLPKGTKYFLYRYIINQEGKEPVYKIGAFIGNSEESIKESEHLKHLLVDVDIEVWEVNRKKWLKTANELERKTKNFFFKNHLKEGESKK
jgi:hypothetical protein